MQPWCNRWTGRPTRPDGPLAPSIRGLGRAAGPGRGPRRSADTSMPAVRRVERPAVRQPPTSQVHRRGGARLRAPPGDIAARWPLHECQPGAHDERARPARVLSPKLCRQPRDGPRLDCGSQRSSTRPWRGSPPTPETRSGQANRRSPGMIHDIDRGLSHELSNGSSSMTGPRHVEDEDSTCRIDRPHALRCLS